MNRARVSLVREDRIWDLRCQGYSYDQISRLVNLSPHIMTTVLRRVRRRPPIEVDPIRRGRRSGWMSDSQIDDIRTRRARGETLFSIAKSYDVDSSTVWAICKGRSYKVPEAQLGYPWSFANRLVPASNEQVAA